MTHRDGVLNCSSRRDPGDRGHDSLLAPATAIYRLPFTKSTS